MRKRTAQPAVVFIPGFMQPGAAWAPVAERIPERYPSKCFDFSSHTLEGRLDEIARGAPPGAVLAGYSMGGRLALHAGLRHPGRFAGLILVGASAGIDDADTRAARRADDERLAAWIERRPIEQVVERWEAIPAFASQRPELVAAQRPGRLGHDPRDLALLLRSAGQGTMEPVWERLPGLDLPLLVITGELDAAYVSAGERIAALAPRARAAVVEATGHAPQLERPEAVAKLVERFLDEDLGEILG